MKQVKIFCGRSLGIEESINNWLQNNTYKDIIDIKISRGDSFIYALVVYETI